MKMVLYVLREFYGIRIGHIVLITVVLALFVVSMLISVGGF